MRLTWPLTGRSKELRLIEAAIFDPDSSGVVICGAVGVGKSRMAREALNSVVSMGCEVRWIVGTSSAHALPLGALASWAEPAVNDHLDLVRGVITSLTAATPGKTAVLGVDDVALLDDLSTFVVHQIIQRRAAKVVLTVRDGEPIPAGTRELWKTGQFDRLDVRPLTQDAVAPLVSATLGGPLDPQAAERLWTLTRGNPLYLRNIVEQEFADERLVLGDGCWRWLGDPVVPPDLVELIEERFRALPPSVGDVVDALAVGEPIELGSITRITDPGAVEEADMRGLITLEPSDGGVEVRVAHPMYGEVRRSRAAPTRLRRLRGLVANELANSKNRDDIRIVVRRAALSLDSDLKPDAGLLLKAAQGAVWLVDVPLADRLADAAIRAGAGARAVFIRAYILSWLGRGHDAEVAIADGSTSELTDVDADRLSFVRATNRLFSLADPAGAKALIDDALRSAQPGTRNCIDAALSVYWAAMGQPEAARKALQDVVFDALPDIARRLTAWAATVAAGDAGRMTEAVSAAEAGYPIAVRGFLIITDAHVSALWLSGRVADAAGVAEMLRQRSTAHPSPQLTPIAGGLEGRSALGTGQLETARLQSGAAVEALGSWGQTIGWTYRYQLTCTMALAMRGLTVEAAVAKDMLEEVRHTGWRYLDYEYAIAKAWVAACQGAVSEAIATVLAAAETACGNGQFAAEVMCLQTATQFGDHTSGPRLRELEAMVEGPRASVAAQFAEALHAGDAAELASVSKEFEVMGDLVAAVDAASHAAVAYRRRDLRGSALGCSMRAQALAEQCGGAGTPALRQAAEPLPLTDREREIVMLLGEGLSNRDIAARLTVSVRTVESHIYKAMAKTGTSSRGDLAMLLRQPTTRSDS